MYPSLPSMSHNSMRVRREQECNWSSLVEFEKRKWLEHSFSVNKVIFSLFTPFDCISSKKLVL